MIRALQYSVMETVEVRGRLDHRICKTSGLSEWSIRRPVVCKQTTENGILLDKSYYNSCDNLRSFDNDTSTEQDSRNSQNASLDMSSSPSTTEGYEVDSSSKSKIQGIMTAVSKVYKRLLIDEKNTDEYVTPFKALKQATDESYHDEGDTDKIKYATVLIHGYAASSVSYYRSMPYLSSDLPEIYAIDLPGHGLSLAPDSNLLPKKSSTANLKAKIQSAENYYIDKIEAWREARNLHKINIVGHSFGGYLSFKYALKYPERVHKLCLVSPVGVERHVGSIRNNEIATTSQHEDPSKSDYSRKFEVPSFLFNNQLNVLKWLGPVGTRLCQRYINASYARVPDQHYKDYLLYALCGAPLTFPRQNVSAFNILFNRHILANDPILDNLKGLPSEIDVTCIYGQHDWMDKRAGTAMVKELRSLGHRTNFSEISNAGHNLILDNPKDFSQVVSQFLQESHGSKLRSSGDIPLNINALENGIQ